MKEYLQFRKRFWQGMGFSQAELLIVVAIIGITASVATMAVNKSINNAKLQNAADKLVSDLQLLRDSSRRDQQSYTLSIDPQHQTYSLPETSVSGSTGSNISVDLRGTDYLVSGISYQLAGTNSVTFDARGRADPAGAIVLHSKSRRITINITPGGYIEQID